ncbi:hypothetical protein Y032_0417g1108 [Ancylostoma ceylanicum]|nr:hypothetical protein Y032_0417g1108 [Ancylostoma ceylanicum]
MGIVKSVSEQENTTNHVLGDPEDMNKDFEVLTYNGVSETELGTSTFVEGTKVIVVGKLRSLSDRHVLHYFLPHVLFTSPNYRLSLWKLVILRITSAEHVISRKPHLSTGLTP